MLARGMALLLVGGCSFAIQRVPERVAPDETLDCSPGAVWTDTAFAVGSLGVVAALAIFFTVAGNPNALKNEPQVAGPVLLFVATGVPFAASAIYGHAGLDRCNPENGWSLFGLEQALRAQGKDAEAAVINKRFKKAWEQADVVLSASSL